MRLAHAYLIHEHFLRPSKPYVHVSGQNVAAWHLALGEPLENAVLNLRKSGFLIAAFSEPFPREAFQSAYFELLRSLPLDWRRGKSRDELIDEAISQNYEHSAHIIRKTDIVIASNTGKQLAETYAARHKKAQVEALESFRERDIPQALEAAQRLRDDLGIPLGTIYQKPVPQELLRFLANASPTILASISPSLLEELRGELAVSAIIDTARRIPETDWPADQQGNFSFSRQAAKDMLHTAAINQFNLLVFRRMGTERVGISNRFPLYFGGPPQTPSCSACLTLQAEDWPIDAPPELPHPACTHSLGCRCRYVRLVPPRSFVSPTIH
jgi:hypothetical protein